MSSFDLTRRSLEPEWMDELSIQDTRLTDALADLRIINRTLGGWSTSIGALAPLLRDRATHSPVKVLDIGCGGGDFAEALVRWADHHVPNLDLQVTGVDHSPATVAWADANVKHRLPDRLAARVTFVCCDAFAMPFASNSFDFAHASLFTHHFSADRVVQLLREMDRVATDGLIINDLHRHTVALSSISLLSSIFNASDMVKHDGAVSVRRAFTRDELTRIANAAGIGPFTLSWRWAFRWLLTTVSK